MQVGLFFLQEQTFRIFLAAAIQVPENSILTNGIREALTLSRPRPGIHSPAMTKTMSLVLEMERIANALGTEQGDASQISLPSVAEKIAQSLGVRAGEVGILAVSLRWRHLRFLVPEELKKVGSIPLSSNLALAARTARDSRPEIENNFAAARHATVFEGVRLKGEPAEAIQKLISAPILLDGKVIGVIQISRKGATPTSAGPDFTAEDLGKILALCKPLAKLLRHIPDE